MRNPTPPRRSLRFAIVEAAEVFVPADGFYEWKRMGASKQPCCFEVQEGELFAFAGLSDGWKDASGHWVKTCAILTTTPNTVTSTVHDRMPVILHLESYDR